MSEDTSQGDKPSATTQTQHLHNTVLIVDDDEILRRTAKRLLSLLGLTSVLAADGREAVSLFSADPNRFSLVLLDLSMPVMDGLDTFIALQRLQPEVRVVVMSGYNEEEAMARFPQQGPLRFLAKPFTFNSLRESLQCLVG